MKNCFAVLRSGVTLFLVVIFALGAVPPASSQTAVANVVITFVNVDPFPEVQVQVKPLDANDALIPGLGTNQFSVREDGKSIQVQKAEIESLPLNTRVVFVIDEFKIAPQVQVVREAIQSLAETQMQAGDQVEVLAASEGGQTQTIIPFTDNQEEVINGIQETSYNPGSAKSTLLLDAVNQGLADLSALSENTEGLNTMIVFSFGINDQRALQETIQNAVQLGIPVHTVLLGSEDTGGALGRLALGTGVEAGAISPQNLNDLFETIDAQSVEDQYLVSYRSKVDQPGDHELIVTVNGVSSKPVSFPLDQLEAPVVSITNPAPDSTITRTETFFSEDSAEVQPTEQTVAVEVSWPDGHPRQILEKKTTLVVNGKSLGPATNIRDNGKDPVILEFSWDLRQENTPGETTRSIVVEVEDELELKGESDLLPVTVNYVVFTVENACPAFVSKYTPVLCANFNSIVPIGSLAIVIATLLFMVIYLRRNPKVQTRVKESLGTMINVRGTRTNGSHMGTRLVEPAESAKATLEVVEGKSGTSQSLFRLNNSTTLGRSNTHAQLVFQSDQGDRSPISRLHCTILEKGEFFDLRDEGSSNGTFLNGVRIRSGENHRLSNGDLIELARVQDGGLKLKFQAATHSASMGTRLTETKADDSDELPKDGYTPTKLM